MCVEFIVQLNCGGSDEYVYLTPSTMTTCEVDDLRVGGRLNLMRTYGTKVMLTELLVALANVAVALTFPTFLLEAYVSATPLPLLAEGFGAIVAFPSSVLLSVKFTVAPLTG